MWRIRWDGRGGEGSIGEERGGEGKGRIGGNRYGNWDIEIKEQLSTFKVNPSVLLGLLWDITSPPNYRHALGALRPV